jgi:hypothetical protein
VFRNLEPAGRRRRRGLIKPVTQAYSRPVRDARDDRPPGPGLIARATRLRPRGHAQVWLFGAGYGLIFFLVMAARDELLLGVAAWAIATFGYGSAHSFRLGRSRHSRALAEWAASQSPPPPGR